MPWAGKPKKPVSGFSLPPRPKRTRWDDSGLRRRLPVAVALFAFLIGAIIFLYPSLDAYLAQQRSDAAINKVFQQINDEPAGVNHSDDASSSNGDNHSSDDPSSDDHSSGTGLAPKRSKGGDAAYSYLQDYNRRVLQGTAGAVNDPWGIGSNADELASAGLPDALVGSLTVPSLSERVPIYLGATGNHLSYGVAVVSGTSAPLGEKSSNVVIAGHRGAWRGMPMFRDIEDMQVGDTITINTPWDTLVYEAKDIQIVTPDNVDAVKVQSNRDLVTLLTCHPYGNNYERYLVICERIAGGDSFQGGQQGSAGHSSVNHNTSASVPDSLDHLFVQNPVTEALKPTASPLLAIERWLRVAGLCIMLVALALVGVLIVRRTRQRRKRQSSQASK